MISFLRVVVVIFVSSLFGFRVSCFDEQPVASLAEAKNRRVTVIDISGLLRWLGDLDVASIGICFCVGLKV